MKKTNWKKLAVIVLCFLFVQTSLAYLVTPISVEGAVKSGLKKENNNYYYYVKGKKVKNTWKNIKVKSNGKTVTYKYYFGSNGAAYKGKKEYGMMIPAFKKIKGKYYAFDHNARMLKGTFVKNGKFYVFHSKTGVYDSAATSKLRKASVQNKNAAALRKLLGKPLKTQVVPYSCYGDGKDVTLYYKNFMVGLFRNTKGQEIVVSLVAR
ncbi:MAG: hypothetical protein Q4E89_10925 [Eubacteriales bacterium]|nr:hypothetical protein [Eubacteriales bacterium]